MARSLSQGIHRPASGVVGVSCQHKIRCEKLERKMCLSSQLSSAKYFSNGAFMCVVRIAWLLGLKVKKNSYCEILMRFRKEFLNLSN